MERLIDADQVAEVIGMRVDFVYALARRDQIPHLRFGRTLRFRPEAIADWIEASERGRVSASTKMAGRDCSRPGPAPGGKS